MKLGGYADRIARIDLTSGGVSYEGIDEDDALKYIGARGLGVKYVYDNGPTVDPLAPDNLLCFMNGPLTGTEVTMSGRMAIVTKSPLTGTVMDSHHGGWSAARLRWAGFDGLLFKGRAEKPVYAYVENEKVEIRDASDLWGKGVHETVKTLLARHGGDDVSVIAIGQAGEKLVRYACFLNENDRASGRGGTGCVAGSKQLKAVVIKAKKQLPKPANKDAFKAAHKRALAVIMDESTVTSPRKGGLSVYGTNVLMNVTNTIGALGSRNSQTYELRPGRRDRRREDQGNNPRARPDVPRLPRRLQERSRDARPVRSAHGELRVRASLVARRQLRQRQPRRHRLHHRPLQRLRDGRHRARPGARHGDGGERKGADTRAP